MVDILHKTSEGWEIYEVKSSTDVKPVYIQDSAIQSFALKGCGLNVSKVSVVHIDRSYVRGKELEIDKLFKIVDVTDKVIEFEKQIPGFMLKFEEQLRDKENEPDIDIGQHCSDPYPCDAINYCWKLQKKIPEY